MTLDRIGRELKEALAGTDIQKRFALFMDQVPEWLAPEIADSGIAYTRLDGVRVILNLLEGWMQENSTSDEERELILPTLITLVAQMAEPNTYCEIRDREETLARLNTERNTFEIDEGWGNEWYVAVTDSGLESNPYRAVNHSIAQEKALMVKPNGSNLSHIRFNDQIIWKNAEKNNPDSIESRLNS